MFPILKHISEELVSCTSVEEHRKPGLVTTQQFVVKLVYVPQFPSLRGTLEKGILGLCKDIQGLGFLCLSSPAPNSKP